MGFYSWRFEGEERWKGAKSELFFLDRGLFFCLNGNFERSVTGHTFPTASVLLQELRKTLSPTSRSLDGVPIAGVSVMVSHRSVLTLDGRWEYKDSNLAESIPVQYKRIDIKGTSKKRCVYECRNTNCSHVKYFRNLRKKHFLN